MTLKARLKGINSINHIYWQYQSTHIVPAIKILIEKRWQGSRVNFDRQWSFKQRLFLVEVENI
jgi:hypothetical protein